MAKVILSAEGQTLELADDIAGDDQTLRQALVAYYPQLATAKIERATVDGQMRVTVSKQAGPKGARPRLTPAGFLERLVAAPEHVNPAVELWHDLHADGASPDALGLTERILLGDHIDEVTARAEAEMRTVRGVFKALRGAPAVAAPATPEGF